MEILLLSSILMSNPDIDVPTRKQILWQMRRMLLGAAFSLGSLGHSSVSVPEHHEVLLLSLICIGAFLPVLAFGA